VSPYAWGGDAEAVVLVPGLTLSYLLATRGRASRGRIAAFLAGQALILLAFVTPLQAMALHYLLSAHLLQNVVLAEWAPALCVLGIPPSLASALAQLRAVRLLTGPFLALPLWLGTYFAWHVPWAYDTALEHPTWMLHLEHLCYFATGCLLWWPVVHSAPRRLHDATKAVYLFAAFVLASPLGLLLALLPRPVYEFYGRAPERLWDLSRLADQELAGITMAAEQAVVFFAVFAFFFLRFLRDEGASLDLQRARS
jgi:cytochrome c oxidase assembly factor CtaG